MLHYDWISCTLWIIELALLITGNIFIFIAGIRIALDSVLHYNFRLIFLTLFTRTIILLFERAVVIFARAFIYGQKPLPFQIYISFEQVFVTSQMGFSLLAISIERVVAILDTNYEHRCRELNSRILLPIILYAPSTVLTLSYFLGVHSKTTDTNNTISAIIIPLSYIASGITATSVLFISKSRIKKRHVRGLLLAQKFASVENIRAMSIFIPSVINDVICFLILIGLSLYSTYCTPYTLGEDPTKLSHAYDMVPYSRSIGPWTLSLAHIPIPLVDHFYEFSRARKWKCHSLGRSVYSLSIPPSSKLAAYKSAFIPCFLFYKYRVIHKKSEHENSAEEKRRSFEKQTQIYFRDLHATWKT